MGLLSSSSLNTQLGIQRDLILDCLSVILDSRKILDGNEINIKVKFCASIMMLKLIVVRKYDFLIRISSAPP